MTHCATNVQSGMAARKTKNISLTPRLEKYVAQKVASGRYQSASEVVREAIRIMEQHERSLDDMRRKIAVGLDQARRGELLDGEAVFHELEERLATKLRSRRKRAG